jgi:hypothetical protein
MGYEIVFKYHPQEEDGSWSKEEKELKKKVGDAYEDIPLEKVVATIMSQRARRDIFIYDAEIYEYKKTQISFKETKGGIVIKHKKFLLDDESNIVVQEVEQSQVQAMPQNGTALVPVAINNKVNIAGPVGRPIKWVVLDPDLPNLDKVKSKGLAFLPDKRYPVFNEVAHSTKLGVVIYTMLDENKREVNVTDEYFTNADQRLAQGFSTTVDKSMEPKLVGDYQSEGSGIYKMPDIRGR